MAAHNSLRRAIQSRTTRNAKAIGPGNAFSHDIEKTSHRLFRPSTDSYDMRKVTNLTSRLRSHVCKHCQPVRLRVSNW